MSETMLKPVDVKKLLRELDCHVYYLSASMRSTVGVHVPVVRGYLARVVRNLQKILTLADSPLPNSQSHVEAQSPPSEHGLTDQGNQKDPSSAASSTPREAPLREARETQLSVWLDEIESQIDATVPFYVPRLIAVLRGVLRSQDAQWLIGEWRDRARVHRDGVSGDYGCDGEVTLAIAGTYALCADRLEQAAKAALQASSPEPHICRCGTTMVCPDIGCDDNKWTSPELKTENR